MLNLIVNLELLFESLPSRSLLRHWRRSGVCIGNFEHILHVVQRFLLLTLSR